MGDKETKSKSQERREAASDAPKKPGVKYYRSPKYSGLRFPLNAPAQKQNAAGLEFVAFVPYVEKFQGDEVKVGYLATDNKAVQERCEAYPSVEEISKEQFDKATGADKKE